MRAEEKVDMPKIPAGRGDDLHGLEWMDEADLCFFVAGNQFMVMDELIGAFKMRFPEVKRIFYETLPPRLELKQILAGGARFRGKILPGTPDVYASVSEEAMKTLEARGLIAPEEPFIYLHNRIVLMIPKGNPKEIRSVADLAREDVRISQPNPEYEDIARHIVRMCRLAGGDALVHRIMEEKRAEATTIMTVVHHRETPLRLTKMTCDVGPVWATEVIEAQRRGLAVEAIEPGEGLDQREAINYFITGLKDARHPRNATRFLEFIRSKEAQGIYERYGFVSHFRE